MLYLPILVSLMNADGHQMRRRSLMGFYLRPHGASGVAARCVRGPPAGRYPSSSYPYGEGFPAHEWDFFVVTRLQSPTVRRDHLGFVHSSLARIKCKDPQSHVKVSVLRTQRQSGAMEVAQMVRAPWPWKCLVTCLPQIVAPN